MITTIERPLAHGGGAQTPQRIVVHCMAAEVNHDGQRLSAWELLDTLKLSAHILIAADGTRTRCRRDAEIAWHAKGFNTNTLGVELLVPDVFNLEQLQQRTRTSYIAEAQMASLVEQILIWKKAWPIADLVRHSDLDPARRWYDPGDGFPWIELLSRTWR